MVGLCVQQHFLPLFQSLYSDNEKFKEHEEQEAALQAIFNADDNHEKGKRSGFKDFIKYIKSDGNSSIFSDAEV